MNNTLKLFSLTAAAFGLAQASNAATLAVDNLSATGTATSAFTIGLDNSGTPTVNTFSFSQTGDLDDGLGGSDTLTFEITNIVYTSAESTVAFNGFSTISKINGNPAATETINFYLGSTGASTISLPISGNNQNVDLTGNSSNLFLALTTDYAALEAGNIRLRNLDFSFETSVIPEPGSYALLAGLSGLVLVLARRRRT